MNDTLTTPDIKQLELVFTDASQLLQRHKAKFSIINNYVLTMLYDTIAECINDNKIALQQPNANINMVYDNAIETTTEALHMIESLLSIIDLRQTIVIDCLKICKTACEYVRSMTTK